MPDSPSSRHAPRSSRQRYRAFVEDYKHRRLDSLNEEQNKSITPSGSEKEPPGPKDKKKGKAKRRQYVREYLRWLSPHRYEVGAFVLLALAVAGLQMVEP